MVRKTKKPAELSALLKSSTGTLSQIAAKTNSLSKLADIVRQICPDLPEDAIHIANFNNDSLIIEVKSSVWGQRLQFERMRINQKLTDETDGLIRQIEIKVSPYRNKKVSTRTINKPGKKISVFAASQLKEVAENKNIPESLKEKIERLAALSQK